MEPAEIPGRFKVWFERVGANRGYSHFVYKDVLFLMLSTEDPPKKDITEGMEDNYLRIKAGQVPPAEAGAMIRELEDWAGRVSVSDAQVNYFKDVLKANPKVRWTFAFMHSPPWAQSAPKSSRKPKQNQALWRGGRDSNAQPPAVGARKRRGQDP
jgi:hypothetical protein